MASRLVAQKVQKMEMRKVEGLVSMMGKRRVGERVERWVVEMVVLMAFE